LTVEKFFYGGIARRLEGRATDCEFHSNQCGECGEIRLPAALAIEKPAATAIALGPPALPGWELGTPSNSNPIRSNGKALPLWQRRSAA